jgi:two-component system sensor histidine kinase AtoS
MYAVIAAIGLSCAATWLVVNLFIRKPLNKLAHGMEELAEKRFDLRLDEVEIDEFSALASNFNDMATMLSSSLRELQKTRDYLEGILESSADIIITVNASGNIRTLNAGAEKALDYNRGEVLGKPIEVLFADPYERDRATEKLRHSKDLVNWETQFITRDGTIRDVLLTISKMRNPRGEVIGTIGIGKDITEEKSLQVQLMQSQRFAAIGEVFTGIQHSMKNMLNACKGGAYMVRTGLKKDNRKMLEQGWDIVQEGISGMTEMSMDMLKYVKEWKPRLDRTDLKQTIAEIDRVITQTASDKGIAFSTEVAKDLPVVICDARMIHSAALDIISNAIDACSWKDYGADESGRVDVRAYVSDDGKDAVIEVSDNGCGMTEEVKERIFKPFFSTKSRAGTGLGLSIAMRMVGVHSGKIEVDSKPDEGTVFRIVLPIDGTGKSKEESDAKESAGS